MIVSQLRFFYRNDYFTRSTNIDSPPGKKIDLISSFRSIQGKSVFYLEFVFT